MEARKAGQDDPTALQSDALASGEVALEEKILVITDCERYLLNHEQGKLRHRLSEDEVDTLSAYCRAWRTVHDALARGLRYVGPRA